MRRSAWGACLRSLALALLVLSAAPCVAQTPSDDAPAISLLTFAPGEIYWQRFGHNALLVREHGESRVYNYGIFDFQQKNFFLNFARGRMLYRLDVAPLHWTLRQYAAEGRWAIEQRLDLTPAQSRELADFLAWNAQPENADYRYDYFTANCSTRVRDALDRALDGALRPQLEARRGHGSYRSEVLRLMSPVPALMIGMDLGLGPRVDAPLDQWQEGFVPMRLMDALRGAEIDAGDGVRRPLISAERHLIAGDAVEPVAAPALTLPFLLAGLGVAAMLALLHRWRAKPAARIACGVLTGFYVLVCGLAGLVLALGWLATEHWGMAVNRNLLLLNPVWLLLVPAAFAGLRRAPRGAGPSVRAVALALVFASALSLHIALLGLQPNLHWIALLLPAHAVVLFTLSRRT